MDRLQILITELALLKKRVAQLEKAAYSSYEYVEGWTSAGEIVGVNARTCKRRLEAGTFPMPCRIDTLPRGDGTEHERPVWRRADLVAYAEGCWRAPA